MGKCKDCKWWTKDNFLRSFTDKDEAAYRCTIPQFGDYVSLGMNQEDGVYFSGEFGCILFEAKSIE